MDTLTTDRRDGDLQPQQLFPAAPAFVPPGTVPPDGRAPAWEADRRPAAPQGTERTMLMAHGCGTSSTAMQGGSCGMSGGSSFLGGRRGMIVAAVAVAAAGIGLGWGWLGFAAIAPLLYTLPCAGRMFMCMRGMGGHANPGKQAPARPGPTLLATAEPETGTTTPSADRSGG